MTPVRTPKPQQAVDPTSFRIAVTGSTGMVGSALVPYLTGRGHQVSRLVRKPPAPGSSDIRWDPARGQLVADDLEGFDAIIHLAERIASLSKKPSVLLSGSAIGIYGNRGDEWLDESSAPASDDFLARVAQEWEAAAEPAARAGVRVVHPRLGIVLSPAGGALERLLTVFRLGAGGKIGSGEQWLSWIARDDVIAALLFLLKDDEIRGPVNVVAPNPETNAQFSKTLGHVIGRPSLATVPEFAVRLMLGAEMANATVLASQRVRPKALDEFGFRFRYPHLEEALRHEIAKSGR